MNSPRKLSRLDIIFGFFKVFRSLLPAVILLNINVKNIGIGWIIGIIAAIGLSILFAWLSWSKFSFSLAEDRLIIKRGIWNREEKIIYYNRIHSVNLEQPFIYRIFNVAKLQIETPGGKKAKAEGELRALSLNHALDLQRQLKGMASAFKQTKAKPIDVQLEQAMAKPIDAQLEQAKDTPFDPYLEQEVMPNVEPLLLEEEERYDYFYRLSLVQLLKASLTSLNFNFAIIFLLGVYSIADDVLRLIMPDIDVSNWFEAYKGPIYLTIMILTIAAILFVWLLSIILYLIKFANYDIHRSNEQLSISYGLLDKKTYIFDQRKIQAVIVEENPLRQLLGFAELKVQVVTSDSGKEQLVVHPFLHRNEIASVLNGILPQRNYEIRDQLHRAPKAAWYSYFIVPMVLVTIIVIGGIWFGEWSALWFLALYPLVALWCYARLSTASIWLSSNVLVLRNRLINRRTFYVMKRNIVHLKVSHSPRLRKKDLRTISVQVLGSLFAYKVMGLRKEHVEQVWKWYSRRK